VSDAEERELTFTASDGWPLSGILRHPSGDAGQNLPAVLMVPDSFHERDVYESLATTLDSVALASMRLDIRGRGASRDGLAYAQMGPGTQRRVRLDVGAALAQLAETPGVTPGRLAVVAERNTAPDVIAGAAELVTAAVVLGAWPATRLTEALVRHPVPVFGLVSAEDRVGVRGTIDAYLAGRPDGSRVDVLHGRGFGTTMFSTGGRRSSLEPLIATWLAEVLS
jgi:hypothetical protein